MRGRPYRSLSIGGVTETSNRGLILAPAFAALLLLGACGNPPREERYAPPEQEAPPAADLAGAPEQAPPEADMDAERRDEPPAEAAEYRPSDIPDNLLVTRKTDEEDPHRTVLVISNHPIANPGEEDRTPLAGGPDDRASSSDRDRQSDDGQDASQADNSDRDSAPLAGGESSEPRRFADSPPPPVRIRPRTVSRPHVDLAPTPRPHAAPAEPVKRSEAPEVVAPTDNAATAAPDERTKAERRGVSPVVWGLGLLAVLAALLLAVLGRDKPKKKPVSHRPPADLSDQPAPVAPVADETKPAEKPHEP
jgi:hypothetical protein